MTEKKEKKKYYINLDDVSVNDELEGHWWHYIRPDFAFAKHISKSIYNNVPVSRGAIFIHKQKIGDDRYPTTRYHVVLIDSSDNPYTELIDGKEVRKRLSRYLEINVKKKKILPFACGFISKKSDDILEYLYEPIKDFVYFTIFMDIAKVGMHYQDVRLLSNETKNPLSTDIKATYSIEKIENNYTLENIAFENNDSICIFDANITAIDTRKSVYQEIETIWFLITVENGRAAKSKKKSEMRVDFDKINVKASYRSIKDLDLKINDSISFCGKLKMSDYLGLIIQNVRKFEK